jgi:hypothetical protein
MSPTRRQCRGAVRTPGATRELIETRPAPRSVAAIDLADRLFADDAARFDNGTFVVWGQSQAPGVPAKLPGALSRLPWPGVIVGHRLLAYFS